MKKVFIFILMFKISIFIFFFGLLPSLLCAQLSKDSLYLPLNSKYFTYAPMFSPDGKTLFFSCKAHPLNVGDNPNVDIWSSTIQANGTWSAATNVGQPINSTSDEQVVGLNLNADVMLLLNSNTHQLLASYRKGRLWSTPRLQCLGDMPENSKIMNAHVSTDLNFLMLCVLDSTQHTNIYVSFLIAQDQWTTPLSIGERINTNADEDYVFLNSDNRTVFFHRTGKTTNENGLYKIIRADDTWQQWSTPEKMRNTENIFSISLSADAKQVVAAYPNQDGKNLSFFSLDANTKPIHASVATVNIRQNVKKTKIYPSIITHSLDDSDCRLFRTDNNGVLRYLVADNENLICYANEPGFFSTSILLAQGEKQLIYLDQDLSNNEDATESTQIEQLQIRLNKINKEISDLELRRANLPDLNTIGDESSYSRSVLNNSKLNTLKGNYNSLTGKKTMLYVEDNATFKDIRPQLADSDSESLSNTNIANATSTAIKKSLRDKYLVQKTVIKDSVNAGTKPLIATENEDKTATRQAIDDIAEAHNIAASPIDFDFDVFEDKVVQQLRAENQSVIVKELSSRLLDEIVSQRINTSSNNENKDFFKLNFNVIKKDIEKTIQARLQNVINDNNTENYISKDKNILRIEQQLRKLLSEDVKDELRNEWTLILRREILWHTDLYLKTNIRVALQSELLNKRRGQGSREKSPQMMLQQNANNDFMRDSLLQIQKTAINQVQDIVLYPIQNDQIIPLKGVFFESNASTLLPESSIELDRVLLLMNENPTIMIEIQAHTNGSCTNTFATQLTQRRAQSIMDYLVNKGQIATERFQLNGYGKMYPITTSNTLTGRVRNQRIEIKIKK